MTLDLNDIGSVQELHLKFKTVLGFREGYGMNWSCFRNSLGALDNMPEELLLINWKSLEEKLAADAEILREIITDFNRADSNSEIAIEQVY